MNNTGIDEKNTSAQETCENVYEKDFLTKLFDLHFRYTNETCTVDFNVDDFMHNPLGVIHGGVIAFILDAAMGHLCKKEIGTAVTAEMKVQYLKAVNAGKLQCEAKFLKKGRSLQFLESRLTDLEGNLIAMATGTFVKVKE